MMKSPKIKQLRSFIICFFIIQIVAISKDQCVQAKSLIQSVKKESHPNKTVRRESDGSYIIYTGDIASNVKGFGGATPLKIHIKDGIVRKIDAEPNDETPEFFSSVVKKLFPKWVGKTISEATTLKVDAVTGATMSSQSVIENMKQGLDYAKKNIKPSNKNGARKQAK